MERLTHISSILQPGAEPYSHSEVIRASATIDTTAILLDELAKLGEPLPIEIAAHGFARISDDVTRLLLERGQQRHTEAQWRSALREVFKQLTDSKGDTAHRSPNLARKDDMRTLTSRYEPSAEDVLIAARQFDNGVDAVDMDSVRIHARAEQILRDGQQDDYLEAAMQAQRELEPAQTEATRGCTHEESLELHVEATKLLRARGIYKEDETHELYASALDEAATTRGISLTGMSA